MPIKPTTLNETLTKCCELVGTAVAVIYSTMPGWREHLHDGAQVLADASQPFATLYLVLQLGYFIWSKFLCPWWRQRR